MLWLGICMILWIQQETCFSQFKNKQVFMNRLKAVSVKLNLGTSFPKYTKNEWQSHRVTNTGTPYECLQIAIKTLKLTELNFRWLLENMGRSTVKQ